MFASDPFLHIRTGMIIYSKMNHEYDLKHRWINKFDYLGSMIFGNLIGFKSGRLLSSHS